MSNVDPEFVKRLVENHWSALVLYARQWCADPEDVVQESLLKLFRQSTAPRDAEAWIYHVVRNQAISTSRSSQRRLRRENVAGNKLSWFANTEDDIDARTVTSALQELPDDVREVIVTRIWGGLTYEQISKLCGASVSTVYRRYEGGLSLLREKLGVKEKT